MCRDSRVYPTEQLGRWQYRAAGRFAVKMALTACLLLAALPAQRSVAATVLEGEHCLVEFDSADRDSAELVRSAIDACWDEVAESVGANAESPPVRVRIAASLDEFRKFAGGDDRTWIVGLASGSGSLILLKPPRLVRDPLKNFRQTVRHELTHIMLSRASNLQNMPRWLNEGIALRVSGEMTKTSEWIIGRAVLRGAVIPLDELDERFPAAHERASLAYAESLKAVNYIVDEYGDEALLQLIRSLRDEDFDTALSASVGLDIHALSERWVKSVRKSPYVVTLIAGSFSLWLMTVLAIVAFLRKRKLARRKRWEWEMEELLSDDL